MINKLKAWYFNWNYREWSELISGVIALSATVIFVIWGMLSAVDWIFDVTGLWWIIWTCVILSFFHIGWISYLTTSEKYDDLEGEVEHDEHEDNSV